MKKQRFTAIVIVIFFLTGLDTQAAKTISTPPPRQPDTVSEVSGGIYTLLLHAKFREAAKQTEDPDLKQAIEALLNLNKNAASSYENDIGKQITLTVDGLPLTGTLVKIKNSALYMKLKRGKGSVVMPVKMGALPLDERVKRVKLPALAEHLCFGIKFFLQKNYQGAVVFLSKTGKYADGLTEVLTKESKYFLPLLQACRDRNFDEIKKFIAKGADVNGKCSAMVKDRKTGRFRLETSNLLIETIKSKRPDVAVFLIENGSDVNQQNSEGVSPLMFAIMWTPDPKFIDFLIKHKAKLEHKDISGNTPLSGAVAMGRKDVVKVLLNSGADPNEANSKGYTPVMIAVMTNKAEILTMLLGAGADITRPHPKGWTVFQLSQKKMTPAVREIINAYAPKKPVQKKKKQTIGFPDVQIVR